MKGIVVGTTGDGQRWVDGLKATLRTDYPVVTVRAWELEAIDYGCGRFEEFVFLPQSTEILDNSLWELLFVEHAGRSVSLAQHPGAFGMYLGKYRSDLLREIELPRIRTKHDAIYWEDRWAIPYMALEPDYVRLGDLPHSNIFEERNGRLNMVVENRHLRRFKGSWDGLSSASVAV